MRRVEELGGTFVVCSDDPIALCHLSVNSQPCRAFARASAECVVYSSWLSDVGFSASPNLPGIVPVESSWPKRRSTSEKGIRPAMPPRGAPRPRSGSPWSGAANDRR